METQKHRRNRIETINYYVMYRPNVKHQHNLELLEKTIRETLHSMNGGFMIFSTNPGFEPPFTKDFCNELFDKMAEEYKNNQSRF